MLGEFLGNLQIVAVQVIILYLIAFVGFFAEKSKIFVRADATKLVDLIFYLIFEKPITKFQVYMD